LLLTFSGLLALFLFFPFNPFHHFCAGKWNGLNLYPDGIITGAIGIINQIL
jgi:hypothetical protein